MQDIGASVTQEGERLLADVVGQAQQQREVDDDEVWTRQSRAGDESTRFRATSFKQQGAEGGRAPGSREKDGLRGTALADEQGRR